MTNFEKIKKATNEQEMGDILEGLTGPLFKEIHSLTRERDLVRDDNRILRRFNDNGKETIRRYRKKNKQFAVYSAIITVVAIYLYFN